ILVLAIVTRRFRVPLMWTLLDHAGNSATAQRIELMERYLRLFGAPSIRALLADREFVGAEWMDFLNKNNVPFVIRLKEDMLIRLADGSRRQFRTLLRKPRRGTWGGWLTGMDGSPDNQLRCAAKRIKGGELLIVATNLDDAGRGLNLYRKRWGIECMFADAKTRGFNIEDTHITDPDKLATLLVLVLVALAVTWAYRCATRVMGRGAIRRKGHGRREKSWFRTGLDALRNWIIHHPGHALEAWTNKCPRRSIQASK
ncbi:transposase, partial [Marivita sp.]|uniref:transposase n=1 Tax=Marivita sp. TaxID=2003365 RepID=UPI00261E49D1